MPLTRLLPILGRSVNAEPTTNKGDKPFSIVSSIAVTMPIVEPPSSIVPENESKGSEVVAAP